MWNLILTGLGMRKKRFIASPIRSCVRRMSRNQRSAISGDCGLRSLRRRSLSLISNTSFLMQNSSALLVGMIVLVFANACHQSTQLPQVGTDRLVQAPPGSQESFNLGQAELIPGTTVFRVNLSVNREGGFGSDGKGSYFETRNILFIDPSEKAARWLLPDTNHVIEDATDIGEPSTGPPGLAENIRARPKKTVAILTYVKDKREHWRDFPGQLM